MKRRTGDSCGVLCVSCAWSHSMGQGGTGNVAGVGNGPTGIVLFYGRLQAVLDDRGEIDLGSSAPPLVR
jgi:hypothetical protein